ncbi:MAG: hypothetical protein OXG49_17555 [Chloroflexi bacterium]|nr:hypothetical protein [Chloroflexota bacterium]
MIAPELLKKLQKLNQEEKLEVVRFLNEKLSNEMQQYLEGRRVFKIPSRFVASDGGAAMRLVILEHSYRNCGDTW